MWYIDLYLLWFHVKLISYRECTNNYIIIVLHMMCTPTFENLYSRVVSHSGLIGEIHYAINLLKIWCFWHLCMELYGHALLPLKKLWHFYIIHAHYTIVHTHTHTHKHLHTHTYCTCTAHMHACSGTTLTHILKKKKTDKACLLCNLKFDHKLQVVQLQFLLNYLYKILKHNHFKQKFRYQPIPRYLQI